MILDSTYTLSDDQIASQFEVTFTSLPGGGAVDSVTLRMDKDFQPPEITAYIYDYYMQGHKYSKPGMLDETDKTLSIAVRIDQNWEAYDALYEWKKMCFDHETGTRSASVDASTTMTVNMLGNDREIVKTFTFGHVYCKGLALDALDNASGDPLRVTLNMTYNTLNVTSP